MGTQDRRVRKSKEALYKAAITLMKEKDLSSITIKELTELADVNRGTFYAHYEDIYDFVESMENEIIEDLGSVFSRFSPHQVHDCLFPMLEFVVRYFAEEPYCHLLTSRSHNAGFANKLVERIRDVYLFDRIKTMTNNIDDKDIALYEQFLISGYFSIIAKWLDDGKPMSPDELALKMNQLGQAAMGFLEKS